MHPPLPVEFQHRITDNLIEFYSESCCGLTGSITDSMNFGVEAIERILTPSDIGDMLLFGL